MIKWLIACSALIVGPAWGQGFALRSDHLVVEEQRHWEVWDFPLGTIDIVEGVVQPNFVRKNIDATQDILTHLRRADDSASLQDAFLAASNQRDITNLLDRGPGSETTYWEPRVGSDSRDWWFQLDLGRLISADRIVLQFADEEIGDPFLQFVVLTSDGGESIKGVLGFKQAFRTQKNNKTQRVFEIDLEPAGADLDNVFTGDMIRYVQVLITESDTTRAAQITAERYAESSVVWSAPVPTRPIYDDGCPLPAFTMISAPRRSSTVLGGHGS